MTVGSKGGPPASGAHLVQLLLPLERPGGARFPADVYREVTRELTERFGGVTAYNRAPASGLWEERSGRTEHDDIVVYEVMVESLDPAWWGEYRQALERRFEQEELVVRAQPMRRL
jgi:hypothetical protein